MYVECRPKYERKRVDLIMFFWGGRGPREEETRHHPQALSLRSHELFLFCEKRLPTKIFYMNIFEYFLRPHNIEVGPLALDWITHFSLVSRVSFSCCNFSIFLKASKMEDEKEEFVVLTRFSSLASFDIKLALMCCAWHSSFLWIKFQLSSSSLDTEQTEKSSPTTTAKPQNFIAFSFLSLCRISLSSGRKGSHTSFRKLNWDECQGGFLVRK